MRTLIFFTAGLLIMGGFFMLARVFPSRQRTARTVVMAVFILFWLIATVFNMLGGIKAGYSFGEELPIFMLLFGVPAGAGLFLRWKML